MRDYNFDYEVLQLNMGKPLKGWVQDNKIPKSLKHTEGGYDASVLVNEQSKKVVIAMEGSSAANVNQFVNDWVKNNLQKTAFDELPPQFTEAQKLYNKVWHEYQGYQITSSGLSAGAVYSSLLVAANPGLKGIGFSTIGIDMVKLRQKYPHIFKNPLSNNMFSYINEPDWLANFKRGEIWGGFGVLHGPEHSLLGDFLGPSPNNISSPAAFIGTTGINMAYNELNYRFNQSHGWDAYKNLRPEDLSKAAPVKQGSGGGGSAPDNNENLDPSQYLEMLKMMSDAGESINNYPPHTESVSGEIYKPHYQTNSASTIKSKDLYDPVVQNFIENWPNVKGVIGSYEQYIWGKKDDNLYNPTPAAAQPFNRVKPYSPPNSQTIQKVLYSGVEYGKDYAKGYLYDRGLELAFGKKAAGKIKKAEGYSNAVKTYAPNTWQAASAVLSRTLNSVGYTIGSVAGWVATGVDLGIKAIGLIPFIGPMLATAASAVAYAAGYAIGATLGAASWALTALAALAW